MLHEDGKRAGTNLLASGVCLCVCACVCGHVCEYVGVWASAVC